MGDDFQWNTTFNGLMSGEGVGLVKEVRINFSCFAMVNMVI